MAVLLQAFFEEFGHFPFILNDQHAHSKIRPRSKNSSDGNACCRPSEEIQVEISILEDMKWITRERVKVDRVACPWLIRKFVDPAAEFVFVLAAEVMARAKAEGPTPFDVAGVELGHHDGKCSFEAIVTKYRID